MTIRDVATELGISEQAVGYHIRRGNLKATNNKPEKMRGSYDITREDLEAFKAARKK